METILSVLAKYRAKQVPRRVGAGTGTAFE